MVGESVICRRRFTVGRSSSQSSTNGIPAHATVGDGWWFAQVQLDHGHHQYRFLVDGRPMLDPQAADIVRDEADERASLMAVS